MRKILFNLITIFIVLFASSCSNNPTKKLANYLKRNSDKGYIAEIQTLTDSSNFNLVTAHGTTALMIASDSGDTELVKLLIAVDVNVNAKTNDGETALMYAARDGHTQIARLLIEAQADVHAVSEWDIAALSWAMQGGHTEIIELLQEAGSK